MPDPFHTLATALIRFLDRRNCKHLTVSQVIPAEGDLEFAAVLPLVLDLQEADLQALRYINAKLKAGPLRSFAERMAVLSLRHKESTWLLAGLYALCLDNDEIDYRELYRLRVLYFDVCLRSGFDTSRIFEVGLARALPAVRGGPVNRLPKGLSCVPGLGGMGYKRIETPNGPGYFDSMFADVTKLSDDDFRILTDSHDAFEECD